MLIKVITPPTPPFAVGAKVTLTERLSPGARTCGSFKVEALKLLLVDRTPEIVTLDCPLLVATTRRVSVWPTTTSAKRRRIAEKLSSGAAAGACSGIAIRMDSTATEMAVADKNLTFDRWGRINQTA